MTKFTSKNLYCKLQRNPTLHLLRLFSCVSYVILPRKPVHLDVNFWMNPKLAFDGVSDCKSGEVCFASLLTQSGRLLFQRFLLRAFYSHGFLILTRRIMECPLRWIGQLRCKNLCSCLTSLSRSKPRLLESSILKREVMIRQKA